MITIANSIINGFILVLFLYIFYRINTNRMALKSEKRINTPFVRFLLMMGSLFAFSRGFAFYFDELKRPDSLNDLSWPFAVLILLVYIIKIYAPFFGHSGFTEKFQNKLQKLIVDDKTQVFTFSQIKDNSTLDKIHNIGCISYKAISIGDDHITHEIKFLESGDIGPNKKIGCKEVIFLAKGEASDVYNGLDLEQFKEYNIPYKHHSNIHGEKGTIIYTKIYV